MKSIGDNYANKLQVDKELVKTGNLAKKCKDDITLLRDISKKTTERIDSLDSVFLSEESFKE